MENLQGSLRFDVTHLISSSPTWKLHYLDEYFLLFTFSLYESKIDITPMLRHRSFFKLRRQDPTVKLSASVKNSPESIVTSKIEKLVLLEDLEELKAPDIMLFLSYILDVCLF
jgi:hypothetical protein